MPTTLTNGIQLPDKGSVDWYSSMESNYNLIDTHLGDTDVHVTAEDKNRWNNQTYVFRYSSTALVASSTNSNTLLDNTDNLKVGDKVIDSSGVLFSITAIDTENSTFTIGTALIDLANDSDVVHKSGNETVGGEKTFVGSQYFKDNNVQYFGIDFSKGTAPSAYTARCTYFSPLTDGGSTYQTSNGLVGCAVSSDNVVTTFMHAIKNTAGATTRTSFVLYYDTDNDKRSVTTNGDFLPISSGQGIGNSTSKWTTINGLNPSSLGMPDLSNGIDISSYITHLDKVVNSYTPPANGYITIRVKKTSLPIISIRIQQYYGLMNSSETADFSTWGTCLPVVAGNAVEVYISADSLMSAIFFPCQGNV